MINISIIKNNNKKILFSIIILISIFFIFNSFALAINIDIGIFNPYQDIKWKEIDYYKANLHTHTRRSDGFHSPMTVVNEYRKNNYDILAITDHNKYTWPWNEYGINYKDINITAVDGSEISNTHHLGSYFNNYASGESFEEKVLNEIEKRDGLALF